MLFQGNNMTASLAVFSSCRSGGFRMPELFATAMGQFNPNNSLERSCVVGARLVGRSIDIAQQVALLQRRLIPNGLSGFNPQQPAIPFKRIHKAVQSHKTNQHNSKS
jgi:hypothetical protein